MLFALQAHRQPAHVAAHATRRIGGRWRLGWCVLHPVVTPRHRHMRTRALCIPIDGGGHRWDHRHSHLGFAAKPLPLKWRVHVTLCWESGRQRVLTWGGEVRGIPLCSATSNGVT